MKNNELKILYFEGAGMEIYEEGSNVGNYRIRTAFLNNEGKAIYIELGGHKFNDKKVSYWRTHLDYLHYITEDGENESIKFNYLEIRDNVKYTKESITKWINKNLNCNFDTIEVLPWLEGYRVHADNRGYNLIDNHNVNLERANARQKAYNKIDQEFRQKLNSKYSVISLLELNDNDIVIRCHASKEKLQAAGMTDNERIIKIEVNY